MHVLKPTDSYPRYALGINFILVAFDALFCVNYFVSLIADVSVNAKLNGKPSASWRSNILYI